MRKLEFKIDEENDGIRIRAYLKNFGFSTTLIKRIKQREGAVLLNGRPAFTNEFIHSGDRLNITIDNSGHMPSPVKADIKIVYEDEDIIVLDKPPFMPVHESRNHIGDTLSNFVSYVTGEDMAFRAVYRLDRDTSGLVLIAKHELAASKLAGKVKKDYFAVVCGEIYEKGTINKPIVRCGDSIIKRTTAESGDKAITHYEPLGIKHGNTLLKLKLETGRTHQIRVHMASIGYPLLGDSLYGEESSLIKRQALHCKNIYFTHPITNEEIALTCDFPDDIKEVI